MTVLLLGGTGEARALAGLLSAAGVDVLSSLAGRVSAPALPVGRVRVGGFGGVDGLVAFLVEHRVTAVVDATHPFAASISAHAAQACARTGTPLVRLARPGWADHPDAGRWTWVDDVTGVLAVPARRPFLTTGRQSLAAFLPWADRAVLARVVDPPDEALPPAWRLVRSRGPYDLAGERALLRGHRADLLVTKDSGGEHTAAKLAAARELDVRVVVVRRPAEAAANVVVTDVPTAFDQVVALVTPGSPNPRRPPDPEPLRTRLADALRAADDPVEARAVARATTRLGVAATDWLPGWQVVDVDVRSMPHPRRFFVALSGDGRTHHLSGQPQGFDAMVTDAGVRVGGPRTAVAVGRTFLDATRTFRRFSHRVEDLGHVGWGSDLNPAEQRARDQVVQAYGDRVRAPSASPAGDGWTLTAWMVDGSTLVRHDLTVAANGTVTDAAEVVARDLPVPESV